ncbi:hypothetical protein FIBSPDRAFT_696825, partial [Athelia psychrophila]
RTFTDIVSPVVTALIAANYLSVHTNISHPDLKWHIKALESAKVFLVALFFPDWIYVWALRSYIPVSSRPARHPAYTLSHAFYVIMGGMHFYDQDGMPIRPLDVDTTIRLIEDGEIQLPSRETINGMSKFTNFTQTIAALQLSSFLVKCGLRFSYGLDLAPLEVMAFAHALITVFTFIPWWHKPM